MAARPRRAELLLLLGSALVFLLLHRSFRLSAVALLVNVAPIGPTAAAMAYFGVRLDVARQFTRDAKSLGITIHGTFILGLPGETHETIQETVRWSGPPPGR